MSKIKFSEITEPKEILNFINTNSNRHMNYCHYSTVNAMNSILKEKMLRFSTFEAVNDLSEAELDTDKNKYLICFSALYSENFPMWYLYGGISGKGARISFNKSVFNNLLNEMQIYICEYENGEIVKTSQVMPTDKKFTDVLYVSLDKNKNTYRLKYNNSCNNQGFTKEQYNLFLNEHKGFVKELPWFYEKEFRIMVTVNDDTAQKLNAEDSRYKLCLKINDDIYEKSEIMLGPESVDIDYDKYDGFNQYMKTQIKRSEYQGKVKMNLVKKDKSSIIDCIGDWYSPENKEKFCEYAKNNKYCKGEDKK